MSHQQIDSAVAAAKVQCQQQGVRLTAQREQMLGLLLQAAGPMTAYQLLEAFAATGHSGAKPMTVYRALDFLVQAGLIHRLASTNQYLPCEHLSCDHAHNPMAQFLICDDCQSVQELDIPVQTLNAMRANAEQAGFHITSHQFEMHGRCQQCQDRQ